MSVTWKITNVEHNTDADKGVIHAAWTASETITVDGVDHIGTVAGMESYTPDATAADYTAYADLTEATIIGWVKSTLGAAEVTRVEGKVAAQITKSQTPPTAWDSPFAA